MTVAEVMMHQMLRIANLEEQVAKLTAANHQLAEELRKHAPEKFEAVPSAETSTTRPADADPEEAEAQVEAHRLLGRAVS